MTEEKARTAMRETERKTVWKWTLLTAALGICMMLVWVFKVQGLAQTETTPGAEGTPSVTGDLDYVNKENYIDGYYDGEVNETINTVVNVRTGPSAEVYEIVQTSNGTSVKIPKLTKLVIIGESRDEQLDLWYHVRLEFEGETVEGYCLAEFITRYAKVTFTPTPTPSEDQNQTPTPTIAGADNVFGNNTPTPSEDNKSLVDDSKGFRPYKYMVILCIVIVVLILIYTLYSKYQEKILEKEMDRYSSRTGVEPIEGELEEDFEEAKQDYYNYLKLGDQTDRNLGEELGDPEDIELDINGLFEEENTEEIANTVRMTQQETTQNEPEAEPEAAEETQEEAETEEAQAEELPEEEPVIIQPAPVPEAVRDDAATHEAAVRARLDRLKEQDRIQHKLYGEGEVIDNSDAEIIQIRFGRDLRFLKKEKLARKDLVVF